MVLKKTWIPASLSNTVEEPKYDTETGQIYSVESGKDPFYPRGTIKALSIEDTNSEEENDGTSENVVHVNEIEPAFENLVKSVSLNNMATISPSEEENGEWEANGDPTEIALQVFAHKAGHGKPHL